MKSLASKNRLAAVSFALILPALLLLTTWHFSLAISVNRERVGAVEETERAEKFAGTQMQLYEATLASQMDDAGIDSAEEWLDQKQKAVGDGLTKNSAVTIIEIPEVRILERICYRWKIHVPDGRLIQLAAIDVAANADLATPIPEDQIKYVQSLPVGESDIVLVWEELNRRRIRVGAVADETATVGLTLTAAGTTFEWCRDCRKYKGYVKAEDYSDSTEILEAGTLEKLVFVGSSLQHRLQFFLRDVTTEADQP